MNTANVEYLGELRTQATHIRSGNTILTDAPIDNHGKGEAFSPTDLLATALVACKISIMAIVADKHQLNMGTVTGDVLKIMSENPRRVSKLITNIRFQNAVLTDKDKQLLELAAKNCPVAKSLHPDIELEVAFSYL